MTTYTSTISGISIPFIVPKRGKGSSEVLAECDILGYGSSDGINYMSYLNPYARNICNNALPVTIANDIKEKTGIDKLEFAIGFDYYIERSTPTFEMTYHELNCYYNVACNSMSTELSMGISVPIRIQQAGFIGLGALRVSISQPKYQFFEDILDDVQRTLGIKIYPINSVADEQAAEDILDKGKSIEKYLNIISSCKAFRRKGNGGSAVITTNDIFKSHAIESKINWS